MLHTFVPISSDHGLQDDITVPAGVRTLSRMLIGLVLIPALPVHVSLSTSLAGEWPRLLTVRSHVEFQLVSARDCREADRAHDILFLCFSSVASGNDHLEIHFDFRFVTGCERQVIPFGFSCKLTALRRLALF